MLAAAQCLFFMFQDGIKTMTYAKFDASDLAKQAVVERNALRAERDRLRAALEQVFQHAFDADTPNEAIREDFDAMRDIARAALNQDKE